MTIVSLVADYTEGILFSIAIILLWAFYYYYSDFYSTNWLYSFHLFKKDLLKAKFAPKSVPEIWCLWCQIWNLKILSKSWWMRQFPVRCVILKISYISGQSIYITKMWTKNTLKGTLRKCVIKRLTCSFLIYFISCIYYFHGDLISSTNEINIFFGSNNVCTHCHG